MTSSFVLNMSPAKSCAYTGGMAGKRAIPFKNEECNAWRSNDPLPFNQRLWRGGLDHAIVRQTVARRDQIFLNISNMSTIDTTLRASSSIGHECAMFLSIVTVGQTPIFCIAQGFASICCRTLDNAI